MKLSGGREGRGIYPLKGDISPSLPLRLKGTRES